MNDKKKQATHKQAVLEFLYATAAQSVAHAALMLIKGDSDYAKADKVLENPLSRNGFVAGVQEELAALGAPDLQHADLATGEIAGAAVGLRITKLARDAVQQPARKVVVVELPAGVPVDMVPVFPRSNDFGRN